MTASKNGLIKRLETLEEKKCPCLEKKIILRMWEPDNYHPGKHTERLTIIPLSAEDAKEYYAKGGTDEIIVEVVETKQELLKNQKGEKPCPDSSL